MSDLEKICDIFGAAIGRAGGANLFEILPQLLKAILEKLEGIDQKVTLLQEGPYKTAVDYLKDAKEANNHDEKLACIQRAGDKFSEAAGQVEGLLKSLAHFFSGVCYDLRGQEKIALRRYDEAFRSACRYEISESKKFDKQIAIGGKIGLTAAVTSAPVTVLGGPVIWAVGAVSGPVGIGLAILGAAVSGGLASAGRKAGGFFAGRREKALINTHAVFVKPLATLLVQRGINGETFKFASIVHQDIKPWINEAEFANI